MEILETQSAVLSNYEVCTHLLSLRSRSQTTTPKSPNYETVVKELSTYLSPPPSSPNPLPPYASPAHYTPEKISSLVSTLKKKYGLTKAEALTVVNLRPGELSVLHAIVEECDGRFGEEAQESVLGEVEGALGGEGVDGEGGGVSGGGEVDGEGGGKGVGDVEMGDGEGDADGGKG